MTTTVKERPILFRGPMVRAILDGRKTQTRRIVKPQPPAGATRHCWYNAPIYGWTCEPEPASDWFTVRSRHGQPGDRLWVREKWRCNHVAGMRIEYAAGGSCLEYDQWPKGAIPPYADPMAPSQAKRTIRQCNGEKVPDAWRSSIFMPRWASRIVLEITDVRVERLEEITEEVAVAEGFECCLHFFRSWLEHNGPGSIAANPWVWALTFKRI